MVATRQKNLIHYEQPSDETGEDHGWPAVAHGSPDHDYTSKPKRKRAKTTRSARVSGKSTNHLKEDRFTSLPLDVVYEILAFLGPLDLLNLARTNKALRNHLMSRRSRGAWKAARAATEPPVSICPKAMSEPQLAVLLFTKDCTVCGKPITGSQRTWWILHLRACSPCFRSKVILGRAAVQDYEYLNLDDFSTVLELLPGEPRWGRLSTSSSPRNNYYLSEDVGHMSEVVEHHQLRLEARVEGSLADFEQVIETTKSEVLERTDSAIVLKEWNQKAREARMLIRTQMREARKREITSKLVELGHEARDVQRASYSSSWFYNLFQSTNPLTASAWKRMKTRAEWLVMEENRVRAEREEPLPRKTRRGIFREKYSAFRSSYNAVPVTLMPSGMFLTKIQGIKDVIEAEGTDISPSIFDDAFSDLPNYVDAWRKERKLELTRFVLTAHSNPEVDLDLEAAEEQGILSLATSVFATCGYGNSHAHGGNTIHWIDSIGDHLAGNMYHIPPGKPTSPFEEMQCTRVVDDWVGHAELLVEAVNLDPNTATITDMDILDARFYCNDCCLVKPRGEVVARNWRNCVKHVGFHSKSSPWKGWTLLSPKDRDVVDVLEKKVERELRTSASSWNTYAISLGGKRVHLNGRRILSFSWAIVENSSDSD